jgi:hypothetical protein
MKWLSAPAVAYDRGKAMSEQNAIVICVEPGVLEQYALILTHSLRANWLSKSNTKWEIFCIAPRPGRSISERTSELLKEMQVTVISREINARHHYYPLANKPYSAAFIEKNTDSEVIMFLDTDTICVNSLDPALQPLHLGIDVLASPVFTKGIGRRRYGDGDANEAFWHELLRIAASDCERFERTVITDEEIHAYYNSGVIVAKRAAGLYTRWREILATMIDRSLRPAVASYYREQAAFAAATLRQSLSFQTLDYRANYAVQNYDTYIDSGRVGPEEAMIWHHTNRLRPYIVEQFARANIKKIDNDSVHAIMLDVIDNYKIAIEMYKEGKERESYLIPRMLNNYRRLSARGRRGLSKVATMLHLE